jgi:hypothetical protein
VSFFSKIRGTIEAIFEIGIGGPQIKANAGALEMRNAADSAFAVARVATAVGASDAVPLAQLTTAAPPGPYSTVLYVNNVIGNDATAVRGNQNLPFLTIQAALNAMSTKDTVQLAPQTFLQAQLTVPATVVTGACVGYKQPGLLNTASWPGTEIRSTGANSWEFGANLGISRWLLADIMHQSGIISADGSIAPYAQNALFSGGLWIRDCTGFITAKYAAQVVVRGPHGNGNYVFVGCNIVQLYGVEGPGGSVTATWDAADPLTTSTQQGVMILGGSQIGAITMTKQAHLTIDEFSRTSSVIGSGLTVSGANVPQVVCSGNVGGTIDFASAGAELPDTATVITMDFRGTRFFYNFSPSSAQVGAATPVQFKVVGVAPVNFQTVKLDSTLALPGNTFTADNKIHMTARGADWPAVVLTTPGTDGDINPPYLTGTIDLSAGGTQTKTWAQLGYAGFIRSGVAPDVAFLTASAQLSDTVITTKATTGLTMTTNIVGGDTACSWEAGWK